MSNQIKAIKDELESYLLKPLESPRWYKEPYSWDNIVGLGVGWRIRNGEIVEEQCLQLYVARKIFEDQVDPECLFATKYDVPVDVVPVGDVVAAADRRCYIPDMPSGVSLGHTKVKGGTLGCFVRKNGDASKLYLLSCNHVIAAENQGSRGKDRIIQPASKDLGTSPTNEIATLTDFANIDFNPSSVNTIDAAIAEVDNNINCSNKTPEGEMITKDSEPNLGQKVWKRGRTSELTYGVITGIDVTIKITFSSHPQANFKEQVAISGQWTGPTPPIFADEGDSGSVIVDADKGSACGLLIAVSTGWYTTIATPFKLIKDHFGVEVA